MLERQIATAVRSHPDGEIFRALFKAPYSVICAAEVLAEIGDRRARYPSRDSLAADAGQGAVAIESGKRQAAATTIRARPPPRTRLVPRREEAHQAHRRVTGTFVSTRGPIAWFDGS